MKQKMRFLVFIVIVPILLGTLPVESVRAGNNLLPGDDKLEQIKDNPCVVGRLDEVGVPYFVCRGWAGTESWITVPLTTWETVPSYPLVGVPFYIGLGSEPALRQGTGSHYSFNSGDVTFPNLLDIRGLKTDLQLAPKKQSTFPDWDYNGVLEYDYSTIGYRYGELVNYLGDELDPDKVFDPPMPTSASDNFSTYYPELPGTGVDTSVLQAYAIMSSYHAANPSSYRSEPAYRIEITSHWQVQALVSWDSYRVWEEQFSHYKQVCRPGPSNAGAFECNASTTGYISGHYEQVPVYIYTWGAWQGSGSGDWVTIMPINTSAVLWPDGTLHDHIPILVYQSQPLLQKP